MRVPQVQMPDIYGGFTKSFQDGRMRGAQNKLQAAVQQGGIGSPDAVNALALMDPMGAARMGQQSDQFEQGMGLRREGMDFEREKFGYRQQQDAAQMDMQQRRMGQADAQRRATGEQADAQRKLKVLGGVMGQVLALGSEEAMAQNWPAVVQQARSAGIDVPAQYERFPGVDTVRMWNAKLTGAITEAPAGRGPDTDGEGKIRKEFAAVTGDYRKQVEALGRVKTSGELATPQGDLALIFNYMKMLDPGSVVRESEFALAQNAAPVLERNGLSFSSLARVWSGDKLTPQMRAGLISAAEALGADATTRYQQTRDKYRGIATEYEFDPNRSVIDYSAESGASPVAPPPAAGAVAAANAAPATVWDGRSPLDDGTVIRNPSTGEVMIKRDGQFVPYDGPPL